MAGISALYLQDFYGYLLVFTRFAGFFSSAPLFSEQRINIRLRLLLTLLLTLIIAPAVEQHLPKTMPSQSFIFDLMLMGELLLGVFAGMIGRVLIAALDIAGSLIGFQMGLANAFINSPATAQQTGLPTAYISIMAVLLIFVTGFHQTMIMMMIESYALFQPGNLESFTTLTGDMANTFTRFMSASFLLGLQVGAPVTILGLVMMSAAGIVNRLMPQIQVFFILQPLQILLGFIVLTLSLTIVLSYYIQDFALKYQSLWNMG
tara:strand:- start:878 stop:1663 length:786 start_codon:yes stop_codon:yes gene_type:complete